MTTTALPWSSAMDDGDAREPNEEDGVSTVGVSVPFGMRTATRRASSIELAREPVSQICTDAPPGRPNSRTGSLLSRPVAGRQPAGMPLLRLLGLTCGGATSAATS